jgi:novobiocin biosynthesis protein NovU/D-mycarose 3-C-methyltransferase
MTMTERSVDILRVEPRVFGTLRVERCRVCDHAGLEPVLDLGSLPLAGCFLKPAELDQPEPHYPLRVVLCRGCGLVQLDETVDRAAFSSVGAGPGLSGVVPVELLLRPAGDGPDLGVTADEMDRHAAWLARTLCSPYRLGPRDLVVEAGSGDGAVLRAFRWQGLRVLGIEPNAGAAALAQEQGIETVVDRLDGRLARDLRTARGAARLLLARHVLACSDLAALTAGIRELLAPDGVAVIETLNLAALYRKLAFDAIGHEQVCCFSLRTLQALLERSGLMVVDARRIALGGGSLVVHAVHQGSTRPVSERVARILEEEGELALDQPRTWKDFAERVGELREELLRQLDRLRARSCTLAGYGAQPQASTLLNYCGIGPERIPYLVDPSPHRQGLLTPGRHIPVVAPGALLENQPDVTLLLAWKRADEIVKQQAEYQWRGGRFLVPLPQLRLVGDSEWSMVS